MAAPTLTTRQIQKTVRTQTSKPSGKNVLLNPYNTAWPVVPDGIEEEIIARLRSTLESVGIARAKSNKKHKKKSLSETKTEGQADKDNKQKIRKQILLGVNEVTRGLEKDELRLVLTCRSAQPVVITRHLIGLSASRECPAICIKNLNKTVCEVMNLTSAVAIGFKKKYSDDEGASVFDDIVEFISQNAPEISLPWLPSGSTEKDDKSAEKVSGVQTVNKKGEEIDVSKKSTNEVISRTPQGNNSSENVTCTETVTKGMAKCVDYSQFYVYKSELQGTKRKLPDFISFTGDSNVQKLEVEASKKKCSESSRLSENFDVVNYKMTTVTKIPANPKRKKKKKILLKKK